MRSIISAKEWKEKDNRDILGSIAVALTVLRDRPFDGIDKNKLLVIAEESISIVLGK